MLGKKEQWVNIIFLVKLEKTAIETFSLTPYQELVCLNGTRGFQEKERMWKMMNELPVR